MDFLQNFDATSALTVAIICGGLCLVGVVLFFGIQILAGTFELFAGFFELFTGILAGGPFAWCGCLMAILGCGLVIVIVMFIFTNLQNCSGPNAMNFCRLFGY